MRRLCLLPADYVCATCSTGEEQDARADADDGRTADSRGQRTRTRAARTGTPSSNSTIHSFWIPVVYSSLSLLLLAHLILHL